MKTKFSKILDREEIILSVILVLLCSTWIGISSVFYTLYKTYINGFLANLYHIINGKIFVNLVICTIIIIVFVRWIVRIIQDNDLRYHRIFVIALAFLLLYYKNPYASANIVWKLDYQTFLAILFGITGIITLVGFFIKSPVNDYQNDSVGFSTDAVDSFNNSLDKYAEELALRLLSSKQKEGSTVFSAAQYSSSKPHAIRNVSTTSTEFPSSQVIEYNSLDKVKRLAQSKYIVTFTYGYDGQRTRMTVTDTLTGRIKTKDYVGNCEFVNDNGITKTYTYLSGTYGVFAMVISSGGTNAVHYVYKDHLGSWTTVTDSTGTVVERKSFDAWGNLRNASTWTGNIGRLPKFDRGFTGHEHLYELGLINMNGRMYDPLLSSFLSPDNYMQDPTSQQGFNRYAYCMYNPLKYVDPTGERYFGWSGGSAYYFEQQARLVVLKEQYRVYEVAMESHWKFVEHMINSIYTQGDNATGSGSGNHGSGGGGKTTKPKNFSSRQLNAIVNSKRGKCVFSALGSMRTCWSNNIGWGETTNEWVLKERDYYNCHPEKGSIRHGYEANNILDLITWDKNGQYNKYEASVIGIDDIYDSMEEGWVVAGICRLFDGNSHYVNVQSCTIYNDGSIDINFYNLPIPGNNFMTPYHSNQRELFDNSYEGASSLYFIRIKLIEKVKKP